MIRMHLNEAGVEFLYSLLQRNTREDARLLLRDNIEQAVNKQKIVERFAKDWHIDFAIPAPYSVTRSQKIIRLTGMHFFWGQS